MKKRRIYIVLVVIIILIAGVAVYHIQSEKNRKNKVETLQNVKQPDKNKKTEESKEIMIQQQIKNIKEQSAFETVDVSALSQDEISQLFYEQDIDDTVYQRINGISYQENDNIALDDIRYVRVLHMGFDGQTHVGELIVNQKISQDVLDIMKELYLQQYPIERMVLVDEYLGDDEKSMAANNTSAFNYRNISGTNRLSNHSYGMAIDINPLYNPYVKTNQVGEMVCEPIEAISYIDRNKEFEHKINQKDVCYQLFMEHGFTWGGSWNNSKDYQHFEK